MKNAPIAWIAAMLITLGLGFVLGMSASGGTDEVPQAAAEDSNSTPGRPSQDSLFEQRRTSRIHAPAADQSAPDTERAVRSALSTEDPTAPLASTGAGRIEGVVRTVDQEPLADVVLVATRRSNQRSGQATPIGRAAPVPETLEQALRGAASRWRSRRQREFRTSTNAEGRFVFDNLPDGRFGMRAYRMGFRIESEPKRFEFELGSSIRFVALAVHEVEFDLRLPDGSQPERAELSVIDGGMKRSGTWTPEKSTRQFVKPLVKILARTTESDDKPEIPFGDDRARYRSEEIQFTPSESTAAPFRIDLLGRNGIRGTIANMGDLQNLRVRLEKLAGGAEPTWQNDTRSSWATRGAFVFADLEPGEYAVGIGEQRAAPIDFEKVRVTSGFTECALEMPAPDPATTTLVRCLAPNGAPLANVGLVLTIEKDGKPQESRSVQPDTGADGTALIRLNTLTDIPEEKLRAPYVVHFVANPLGLPPASGTWVPGQEEVLIQLQKSCDLTVQLTGLQDEMREKLVVSIVYQSRGLQGRSESSAIPGRGGFGQSDAPKISADGVVRFPSITPGAIDIHLSLSSGRFATTPVRSMLAEAIPGPLTVSVPLPALHPVVVHAPSLDDGTELELASIDTQGQVNTDWRMNRRAKVEADHRARFGLIPAGTYELTARGIGESLRIVVPTGEILFQAREPDAISITITDENGLLAEGGLQTGDVIVAVGDVELTSENLKKTFRSTLGQKSVFTVIRNGSRVRVDFGVFPRRPAPSAVGGVIALVSR